MTYFLAGFAGILGAVAMAFVMNRFLQAGWANADMIRAVGSLFTRDYETAYGPGITIHLLSGLGFGLLYSWMMGLLPVSLGLGVIAMGVALGLAHGVFVSLGLVLAISEFHPVERFKTADVRVGFAHLVGHVVYGLVVGICLYGFEVTL